MKTCWLLLLLCALDARAADDDAALAARGRRLFLQCSACHKIGDDAAVKIGPSLNGVVGRHVASLPDYTYSASLKSQDFAWDEQHLDRWIERPTQIAPGTTMGFIGVAKPADREALIAYLKSVGKGGK